MDKNNKNNIKDSEIYFSIIIPLRARLSQKWQFRPEKLHIHIYMQMTKTWIPRLINRFRRSSVTAHFAYPPWNPFIFSLNISMFLFIFAQHARSRYESQRERRGDRGGEDCKKTLGSPQGPRGRRRTEVTRAIERIAKSAEMYDKKRWVWKRKERGVEVRWAIAQKAQKTIRLSERWNRDVTSNRQRERTSEAAGGIAWIRFKLGRFPSAFPRKSTKIHVAANRQRSDGRYRRSHADNWNTPIA